MLETPSNDVLRLIDASLNRASEALRVVDDFARFLLDDQQITQTTKLLRHKLSSLAEQFPTQARLAMRETNQDVGTSLSTDRELKRPSTWSVCETNLFRLQEALRSLEEFSKIHQPGIASEFEALRYESYSLAKMIGNLSQSKERLGDANLYVLIPGYESLTEFEENVSEICQTGADIIQLRSKELSDRELIERAERMVSIGNDHCTITIINDRPDIAALTKADGVHVGQEELTVKQARSIVGPDAFIGVSTHNVDQLQQAVRDGASYVGLGPTFTSQTKSFENFAGLDYLKEAAEASTLPAFAIGGITIDNLPDVLATRTTRIAVSGAVIDQANPAEAIKELKLALANTEATSVGSETKSG